MFKEYNKSQQRDYEEDCMKVGPFMFKLKERLAFLYRNLSPRPEALRLKNGRLQELIPAQVLEIAELYYIETLLEFDINNNKLTNCKILLKCHFPKLQILNLGRNKIYNLTDIVNSIHFPELEELRLQNNHIISMRGVKRWSFHFLAKLQMELNFINDIRQITQAYLPSLCQLELYSNNIADFRPFLRSNFPKLETLEIYENTYNSDSKVNYYQLVQRFPQLQIGSLPT